MRTTFRYPIILFICSLVVVGYCSAAPVPERFGAIPTERQLAWHEMKMYAFVHFTINTFTDKEWGFGDELPTLFNPTDFDADQIVSAVKEAGLKGLVLTAKHHDGFCLWPSKYTDHDIANSPFRDGKGDLVREVSEACRRAGIKFGIYLSPWDRNHALYGQPEYIDYYRNQLRELLTNYGPIFEIWFDGANGGDGWYGGANETRKIDRATYYDWENTWAIVRELQPQAVIFSDAGPDCRWIGNEEGFAGDPCWATFNVGSSTPGNADVDQLQSGDRLGTHWIPGEVDVSIRPGWFYHESEDDKVKDPRRLYEIYFDSIGRGANLILNIAPDRRGRVPDIDLQSLEGWKSFLDATFAVNLALDAKIEASEERGEAITYSALNLLDGDSSTYWSVEDETKQAELVLQLSERKRFNVVSLAEFIPLGHRIDAVEVDFWYDETSKWILYSRVTSIGPQRLIRGDTIVTDRVRVRITKAEACPALSELGLYFSPVSL